MPETEPRGGTARQTALRALHAIDAEQAYTDVALRQMLDDSALERRDRAFVTACVYGAVRWQGRIDWLLSKACNRPLDSLTPWIRNILRLGAYQCLWMEQVPPRAAVHTSVELARRFGHAGVAGLVNGVLRTLLRRHTTYALPDADTQPAAHLAVAHSHPQWLVERWLDRYGWARTQALCAENNRPRDVTLRVNTLRTTPQALAQRLVQEGLRLVKPSRLLAEALVVQGTSRLDALPSYRDGLFQVQDEGAMLVAPLCRAQPGQRVLDACAAPGGKTTHLAQLMGDTGQILGLRREGEPLAVSGCQRAASAVDEHHPRGVGQHRAAAVAGCLRPHSRRRAVFRLGRAEPSSRHQVAQRLRGYAGLASHAVGAA